MKLFEVKPRQWGNRVIERICFDDCTRTNTYFLLNEDGNRVQVKVPQEVELDIEEWNET